MSRVEPSDPDGGDSEDLAALDFGAVGAEAAETDLGVLLGGFDRSAADVVDEFGAGTDHPPAGVPGAVDDGVPDGGDTAPTFTVTNPPGTVTVTTFLDGRVAHVDLSPRAATMTETGLAEEIVVIAGLATQDARSAQYTFMVEGMREQGHDNLATRDFLSRDLELPTPEQAQAERAELFTTRYVGEE